MSGKVRPVEVPLAKQIDRSRYNGCLRPHLDAIVTRWSEGAELVEIADWLIQLQVASSAYPRTFIAAHVRHACSESAWLPGPFLPDQGWIKAAEHRETLRLRELRWVSQCRQARYRSAR